MRLFLLSVVTLLFTIQTYGQKVYQIRADSVRIYNVCDTAELILENRTQNINGFLFNKGAGRTEFQQLKLRAVGSSHISILGQDTLDLSTLPLFGAAANNLSKVLANGNTANNNIILGAAGIGAVYGFYTRRNMSSIDYTGYMALGVDGTALQIGMRKGDGLTPTATDKILYFPYNGNTLWYSPDNGTTKHNIWHGGNDGTGSGLDADMLDGIHSTGFIQNQASAAQSTSNFFISGNGVVNRSSVYGITGSNSEGDLTFFEGSNAAGPNARWRFARTTAEGAGNVGSNLEIQSRDNNGVQLGIPLSINRASGLINMNSGFRAANLSGIVGSGTGNTNVSILQFFENNGATRQGYIGKGVATNSEIYIASDIGNINLLPALGSINLQNPTSNTLAYSPGGQALPTLTTRSPGTKAVWFPSLNGTLADFATGIAAGVFWNSIPASNASYKYSWYAGTTEIANLTGTGVLSVNSTVATAGIKIRESVTDARMGVANFVANQTSIEVLTTAVTANSRIFLTIQSITDPSEARAPLVSSRVAGSKFVITWGKTGTTIGSVAWMIVEPN